MCTMQICRQYRKRDVLVPSQVLYMKLSHYHRSAIAIRGTCFLFGRTYRSSYSSGILIRNPCLADRFDTLFKISTFSTHFVCFRSRYTPRPTFLTRVPLLYCKLWLGDVLNDTCDLLSEARDLGTDINHFYYYLGGGFQCIFVYAKYTNRTDQIII